MLLACIISSAGKPHWFYCHVTGAVKNSARSRHIKRIYPVRGVLYARASEVGFFMGGNMFDGGGLFYV